MPANAFLKYKPQTRQGCSLPYRYWFHTGNSPAHTDPDFALVCLFAARGTFNS